MLEKPGLILNTMCCDLFLKLHECRLIAYKVTHAYKFKDVDPQNFMNYYCLAFGK